MYMYMYPILDHHINNMNFSGNLHVAPVPMPLFFQHGIASPSFITKTGAPVDKAKAIINPILELQRHACVVHVCSTHKYALCERDLLSRCMGINPLPIITPLLLLTVIFLPTRTCMHTNMYRPVSLLMWDTSCCVVSTVTLALTPPRLALGGSG